MKKLGFLFPGQGTQCIGMGQTLIERYPFVRDMYSQAGEILGYDLAQLCKDGPIEKLTESRYCQPALFVHQFASASVLKSQNALEEISVAAGLSIGSLTALALAGVYDFEIGIRIVQKRGELIQAACEKTRGGMASLLGVDVDKAKELCRVTGAEMSNVNCPGQIVISGEISCIDEAVRCASEVTGGRIIKLNVAGAFHSSLMMSACQPFEEFLNSLEFHEPQIPVISNVTGEVINDASQIKSLLVKQIVSPVLWWQSMETAKSLGVEHFYQCGTGKTLIGMARRIDPALKVVAFGDDPVNFD